MKKAIFLKVIVIVIFCFDFQNASACTAFFINDAGIRVLGKNYDWGLDDGLIIVNKRGVKKTAVFRKNKKGRPVTWVSGYGSVTFNQYGCELPAGGINEAGLVVEGLIHNEATYPAPDSRPYIGKGQWKQYILDNFSSVNEVIASDADIRIYPPSKSPGLHFFIADQIGNCAVIEFINGKRVVYTKESLPIKAITNSPYEYALKTVEKGLPVLTDPNRAIERFAIAAGMLNNYSRHNNKSAVVYAFDMLKKVDQGRRTKWSIVYDITNLRIHFHTCSNRTNRRIEVKRFEFTCRTPVRILDINEGPAGDVTGRFVNYSREMNLALIRNAGRKTYFMKDIPSKVLEGWSGYPDSNRCIEAVK